EYTMEKQLDHFIENPGYRYLIQETSPLAGVSALKEAPHAKKDYVGVKGREYTFLNVPGYYLLFSQTTTFAFLNTFYNYAYSDNELSHHLINKAISKTWETRDNRHLMFLVNELAVQMEDFAGTKAAGKYNNADFEWQSSSMLPFFLLDVLTHFDMDEAEFKRVYSNHEYERQPRAFQTYWQYRTELQELTAPHLNTSNFKIYEAMAVGHEYLKNKKLFLKTLR
ncbi:MAG: hypothetical protein KDE26_30730, partial [Bacteroidetes bacterium]|nr:hypothetical protein [Bacteroidota bacterium]